MPKGWFEKKPRLRRTLTEGHVFPKGTASSRPSNARLAELKAMPYDEYLHTPEWQKRRRSMLRWSRVRCEVCGARGTLLDVHHKTYERRGHELARDLIVLCHSCHMTEHLRQQIAAKRQSGSV